MKKVIFTGFFGITNKQASHYIKMWNSIGYNVDYKPYNISDIILFRNKYKAKIIIPESVPVHYDIVYSISGGCFHMSNLLFANKHISYDKIIFDSGPYLYNINHLEHFINKKYSCYIPIETVYKSFLRSKNIDLDEYNKNYCDNFLNTSKPKLFLTCKNDNIIIKPFIKQLSNSNVHYEFEKGEHANIYKMNQQLYLDLISVFSKII